MWMGNNTLSPLNWGWHMINDLLTPIPTKYPAAPKSVLKAVSCGCKKDCGNRCSCRKANVQCTAMCSTCLGLSCSNSPEVDDKDDEENEN